MKTKSNSTTTKTAPEGASRETAFTAYSPKRRALEMLKDEYESSNSPAFLAQVAHACLNEGKSEKDTVAFILAESPFELEQEDVALLVHEVYEEKSKNHQDNEPTSGEASVLPEQLMARQQRELLIRRYQFRVNEVTGMTEYRERKKLKTNFRPVDKSVMHNIALDAHEEGINMWDRDVVRYIDFRSGGFAIRLRREGDLQSPAKGQS